MRHVSALPALALACALAALSGTLVTGCTSNHIFKCSSLPAMEDAPAPQPPLANCPPPRDYPFRNLVFEGGGVKGTAYAGALEVLDQQGILPKIDHVAGTSAGAITALLVALRYTPAEIRSLLTSIDFEEFDDGGDDGVPRLLTRYGWFAGDYFLELLRCIVESKVGRKGVTFADLAAGPYRDLHVFATDLDTSKAREFSAATSPGFEVALAVRMSGSYPLFFASVRADGDVFVDGGVLRNYPVDAFDGDQGLNRKTLGFVLLNTGAPSPEHKVDHLTEYAKALFEALLKVQVDALATDPPNLERTVILDDLGIATTDFELTDAQKKELIEQGASCTCSYLTDWAGWQDRGERPSERVTLAPGKRVPLVGTGKCGSAFR